jgi:hypothetical protein
VLTFPAAMAMAIAVAVILWFTFRHALRLFAG